MVRCRGAADEPKSVSLSGRVWDDLTDADLSEWEKVRLRWLTTVPSKPRPATRERKGSNADFINIMEPMRGIPPTPMPLGRFMQHLVPYWKKEGVFDPPQDL